MGPEKNLLCLNFSLNSEASTDPLKGKVGNRYTATVTFQVCYRLS